MKTNQLNIEQLIEKCARQNQDAQLEVYNRFYKAMYNTAFRILKNTQEAEDVMQEAFLNAFTKINTLKNPSLFAAWLKRITVNLSVTALKKGNKLRKVPMENTSYLLAEIDNESSIEEASMKTQEVLKNLQELKPSYRLVLSLHFMEGYDYEEIGDIMELKQGNVRTLISRAKDSLRKKLQML